MEGGVDQPPRAAEVGRIRVVQVGLGVPQGGLGAHERGGVGLVDNLKYELYKYRNHRNFPITRYLKNKFDYNSYLQQNI